MLPNTKNSKIVLCRGKNDGDFFQSCIFRGHIHHFLTAYLKEKHHHLREGETKDLFRMQNTHHFLTCIKFLLKLLA